MNMILAFCQYAREFCFRVPVRVILVYLLRYEHAQMQKIGQASRPANSAQSLALPVRCLGPTV